MEFIGPDRTLDEMTARLAEASIEGNFSEELASHRPTERAVFYASVLEGTPKEQQLESS